MHDPVSIKRVRRQGNKGWFIRPLLLLLLFVSLALAAATVWTLVEADRLMRDEPEPLPVFNSNIMPAFSPVSFPSLDEQTLLQGWFMPADKPISTIILVHDIDRNRLQFGRETPALYRHLVLSGFNVLSFDLRNTGQSQGHLSAYGYAEWADVLAAIRYVRLHASTQDVLLYGFGTGTSAILIAWDQLPAPGADPDSIREPIKGLTFDRSYIKGLLLDEPSAFPDDPIGARYRDRGPLAKPFLAATVPYAVRLSAGSVRHLSHVLVLGSCHLPVFIASQADDPVLGARSVDTLVRERLLTHPDLTQTFRSESSGYAQGFILDREAYLAALTRFLAGFFPAPGA